MHRRLLYTQGQFFFCIQKENIYSKIELTNTCNWLLKSIHKRVNFSHTSLIKLSRPKIDRMCHTALCLETSCQVTSRIQTLAISLCQYTRQEIFKVCRLSTQGDVRVCFVFVCMAGRGVLMSSGSRTHLTKKVKLFRCSGRAV